MVFCYEVLNFFGVAKLGIFSFSVNNFRNVFCRDDYEVFVKFINWSIRLYGLCCF